MFAGLGAYYGIAIRNDDPAVRALITVFDGNSANGPVIDVMGVPALGSDAHLFGTAGVECERGCTVVIGGTVNIVGVLYAVIFTPIVRFADPLLNDLVGQIDS